MRIGEVAREARVTTKTIRYYEQIGVLPEPARLENGYRWYDRETVERLEFIGAAQAAGLGLNEIRHVADLKAKGLSSCSHVLAMMRDRLDRVTDRIRRLEATRNELDRMIQRAEGLDEGACTDEVRCQMIDRPANAHAGHADRHQISD